MNMRRVTLIEETKGTVAVEFAFIAPLLILLFLGTIELANAVICREKVTTLAASAADLVAQDDSISQSQLNDVFSAVTAMLYPYPTSGTKIIITNVKPDPNNAGKYLVDWSVPYNTTAHAAGSSINMPAGVSLTGASIVMAEVSYNYTPPSNQVIKSGFTMSDTFYSKPRKGGTVTYTN